MEKAIKWEGEEREELKGCKAKQVWLLLQDFFGLDKWFPTLSICLPIDGISGQPGCIRFCAGFKTPNNLVNNNNNNNNVINWTKQKLLEIDPQKMVFKYAIIDGNVGFYGYVSTVSILANKKEDEKDCCEIVWKYEVEPVEGWRLEDLDLFIRSGLKVMAQRMVEALNTFNSHHAPF